MFLRAAAFITALAAGAAGFACHAQAAGWEPHVVADGKPHQIVGPAPANTCITVTNKDPGGRSIVVPNRTQAEFQQFINTTYPNSSHGPAGVSISGCGCPAGTLTRHIVLGYPLSMYNDTPGVAPFNVTVSYGSIPEGQTAVVTMPGNMNPYCGSPGNALNSLNNGCVDERLFWEATPVTLQCQNGKVKMISSACGIPSNAPTTMLTACTLSSDGQNLYLPVQTCATHHQQTLCGPPIVNELFVSLP